MFSTNTQFSFNIPEYFIVSFNDIPKVCRVLNGGIPQLDAGGATLLEGLLQKKRLKDWVQLLSNIFKQNLKCKHTYLLLFIKLICNEHSIYSTYKSTNTTFIYLYNLFLIIYTHWLAKLDAIFQCSDKVRVR